MATDGFLLSHLQAFTATPTRAAAPAASPALTPAATPSPAFGRAPALTPSPSLGRAPALTPSPASTPSPALTPSPSSDLARMTGKVKGTLLVARMKFLRSRGQAEYDRVVKRLSAEDQEVLRAMLLPSSWYPAGVLLRLEMTAAAILSKGDRRQLLREMGRFTAETNLAPTGIHRPFVRENQPHFLLENLPRLYGAQHSSGNRTFEKTGATSAIIRHYDVGEAEPDDCLTTLGWLQRAVEISGGTAVAVEEYQCRGRGAPHCEFRVSWR